MTRTPGDLGGHLLERLARYGALRLLRGELAHRHHQQGCVQLAQSVVGAERVLLLLGILRPAAIDDGVCAARERLVVREQRAAFAGRQDLRGLVAEGAEVADAPGAASPPLLAVRVCAVLDHRESVRGGDLHDPVHVGHLVAEVHREDRLRALRDGRLHLIGVDRPGLRRDVDEDRQGAGRHRRIGGGRERQGRDDHLVAPADVERLAGDLHRHRPVHHQDPVRRALIGGERFLERATVHAGLGEPSPLTAANDVGHRGDVLVVGRRPGRVPARPDGCPAVDRELRHRASLLSGASPGC